MKNDWLEGVIYQFCEPAILSPFVAHKCTAAIRKEIGKITAEYLGSWIQRDKMS